MVGLKEKASELLSVRPANEDEARSLLLAINELRSEMDADVKNDIAPHYAEIEKARYRYRNENNALWQKRNHIKDELMGFIENV